VEEGSAVTSEAEELEAEGCEEVAEEGMEEEVMEGTKSVSFPLFVCSARLFPELTCAVAYFYSVPASMDLTAEEEKGRLRMGSSKVGS
jgi:hypothetical protein